ncbi:MAG: NHLP family bacteriocin export ABC transporter peptidase/permease/ATPase subunit [Eubacteriales bacterium]|nr:NHLP family bacteriocin export ABC transporter peptidase/permease/ATPase subunit [Eubacteriales bacterium]
MAKEYVKVPVVMQMEALECGAACLTMILAYHGKWLPLEQVRADCGVSRDGSSAKNMLRAARNYGMKADGYKLDVEDVRKHAVFPCIIHWNFNHFVVLDGFHKGKAVLNDPARGVVQVSMEEFDKAFTGVCMMFSPDEGFEKGGKPQSVLAFAKKRLKGTLAPFIFIVLTELITTVTAVVNPVFSRVFIDRILGGQNPGWLYPLVGIMAAVALIEIVISFLNNIYMLKIQGKLAIVANAEFIWHVLRLPVEFFSQRMAGDIAQRQTTNEGIAASLITELAPLFFDFCALVFYLVIMFRYSAMLAALGVASVLINLFLTRVIAAKRINLMRVQMRDRGKLASSTVSGVEMIETIKASGAENGYFERWAGYQASVNTQTVRFAKLNQYLGALPGLVTTVVNMAVLLLGVLMVMRGDFTVGMILAFQGFMMSFMAPAASLLYAGQSLQEMRTNMERIEDVMRYEPDVEYREDAEENGEDGEYKKLSGGLEMRNVTFGYAKLGEPLIENFSLQMRPGARVAFVGASGCGKSTLSKLISGLYKPWSGEILFDGKPMAAIPRAVFTGSLAVVDQDIILFEDSIRNNIKMWDNSIADFEMILAARDAQIHDDIMQRDGGYSYKIMEGGKDFSGGQRQRMEIARVLAQDPTIIIMDEATSALDAQTEYDVVTAIRERAISCIVVAHRLSTIRDCDEIIVLDHGKVIERGTHDELYAKGGLYTQLITNE